MVADVTQANWPADVLSFWFEELQPADWFTKSDQTDALITQRFRQLHDLLRATSNDDLLASPERALAAVIVLDQFPRNMFRNAPESFASDEQALALAKRAVELKLDAALEPEKRIFLYLPFEHSEALADQDSAVALITALRDESYTRYAHAHRDVIVEFGRFPHRNEVLGRPSTAAEEAFLAKPDSRF